MPGRDLGIQGHGAIKRQITHLTVSWRSKRYVTI